MAYIILRGDEVMHCVLLDESPSDEDRRDMINYFGGDRMIAVTYDIAENFAEVKSHYAPR